MKKALITGGAGFIGFHLARALLNLDYEVTVIDNFYTGNKRNISEIINNPKFTFILHDITEPFNGFFDEIYNLACPASPIHYQKNPVITAKTSILGIINILDLALNTNAKVLHASTSEVYGNPLEHPQNERYWGNVNTIGLRSCYDESKRVSETLCADYFKQYELDIRIVRIFNTYGPNMQLNDGRVISNFIIQGLMNQDITIYGDGLQTRSFQYINDLINGFQKYMALDKYDLNSKLQNEGWSNVPVLNMGNPNEITVESLADRIMNLIPSSKSEIVYEKIPIDDPKQRKPNINLAKKILDWYPKINLEEGLTRTINYFYNILKMRN